MDDSEELINDEFYIHEDMKYVNIPYEYDTKQETSYIAYLCISIDGFIRFGDIEVRFSNGAGSYGGRFIEDFAIAMALPSSYHNIFKVYNMNQIQHKLPTTIINNDDSNRPCEFRCKQVEMNVNKNGILSFICIKYDTRHNGSVYGNVVFIFKDRLMFAGLLTQDELDAFIS